MSETKDSGKAKLSFLSATVGGLLAAAATIVTGSFGFWNDSRELDLRMVDVALAILAGEKGGKIHGQPKEARRFAVNALKQHSQVRMDDTYWSSWIDSDARLNIDRLPGFSTAAGEFGEDNPIPRSGESVTFEVLVQRNRESCEISLSRGDENDFGAVSLGNCDNTPFAGVVRWERLTVSGKPTRVRLYRNSGRPITLNVKNGSLVGSDHESKSMRLDMISAASGLFPPVLEDDLPPPPSVLETDN